MTDFIVLLCADCRKVPLVYPDQREVLTGFGFVCEPCGNKRMSQWTAGAATVTFGSTKRLEFRKVIRLILGRAQKA